MSDILRELTTLRDWLRYATSRFGEAGLFFGHGCDNAVDEAAWLLLHTLHLPHDRLDPFLDARLLPEERAALRDVIELRVVKRLPAAYLTQEAWLGEYRFYVDQRVIVPRSYFASLLQERFYPWIADADQVHHALDLCTGSGCLAIMMADVFPQAAIDAVDLSADALAVAQRNVADYALEDRVELIASDLFAGLDGRRYDLIVCNPPYVTAEAMRQLPPEYRHEPSTALAAGEDGMDIVRRLLREAPDHLQEQGLLAVEVGHNRHIVEHAFPHLDFTWVDTPEQESKIFILSRQQLAT